MNGLSGIGDLRWVNLARTCPDCLLDRQFPGKTAKHFHEEFNSDFFGVLTKYFHYKPSSKT